MSVVWMSTVGTDTASGTTYSLAVKTLIGAKAVGAQGDTIYVVNDGTYPMASSLPSSFVWVGTNYTSDVGCNITGVTSNATAALATFAATGASNKLVVRFDDLADYVTVSGLVFDYSALRQVATGSMNPLQLEGNTRNIRLFDCEVLFTETLGATVTNTTEPAFPFYTGASVGHTGTVEIAGCVLQDASMKGPSNAACAVNYHNNVIIHDGTGLPVNIAGMVYSVGAPSTNRRFYNNTIMVRAHGTDLSHAAMNSVSDDTASLYAHSNLMYMECGAGTAATGQSGSILDGHSLAAQVDSTTMGYDLIALGPNLSVFRSGWTTAGIATYEYSEDFRQGGTHSGSLVPDATSLLATGSGLEDVFNATTTAWTWPDPLGEGYSHVLPFDMRPILGDTTAYDGGAAGAVLPIFDVSSTVTDPNVSNKFLDSLPFFRPIIKAETVTMVRVRRNGVAGHIDLRHYLDEHIHNESTHRIAKIEAAASATLSFAGVATAKGVAILTNTAVQATFTRSGGGSFVTTIDEAASYDGAQFTTLSVSNTSSTTATVQVVAFD